MSNVKSTDADTVDDQHAHEIGRSNAEIREQALAYDLIGL